MIRLFVALPVPEMIRVSLSTLQCGLPGARWTAPENFHVTLRFIGDVNVGQAEDIHDALSRIDAPSVSITLDALSWFGKKKRKPRALIADAQKNEDLLHLQRKVESSVVRCGHEPEGRKYHPHVTLGRLKTTSIAEVDRFIYEQPLPTPLTFEVDRFILYSSFLSHTGSIYTEEAEYGLREKIFEAAE